MPLELVSYATAALPGRTCREAGCGAANMQSRNGVGTGLAHQDAEATIESKEISEADDEKQLRETCT
jgi:hypothetical protein